MYDAHNVTKATEFSIHLVQQTEVLNLESDLYTVVHTAHYLLVHVGNNQHSFNIRGHKVLFMLYTKISHGFPIFKSFEVPCENQNILTTKHPNYPQNIPIICSLDIKLRSILTLTTTQFH